MAHLVETMAYAGATPWHGLGNQLPRKQPIEVWQREVGFRPLEPSRPIARKNVDSQSEPLRGPMPGAAPLWSANLIFEVSAGLRELRHPLRAPTNQERFLRSRA